MAIHQHQFTPDAASITLEQADALAAYARRRDAPYVRMAAISCIDALEGQEGFELAQCETELWEAIDDRRDAPSFYAAMQSVWGLTL